MFTPSSLLIVLVIAQTEPGGAVMPTADMEPGTPPIVMTETTTVASSTGAATVAAESPGQAKTSETPADTNTAPSSTAQRNTLRLELMNASNAMERLRVADALVKLGDETVIPILVYIANNEKQIIARTHAVDLLGKLNTKKSMAMLAIIAASQNRAIAKAAIDALASLNTEATKDILLDLAGDRQIDRHVRKHAKVWISKLSRAERENSTSAKSRAPRKSFRHYLFPALGGGAIGAVALSRIGVLGGKEDGPGLGFTGGAMLGAGAGVLLSEDFTIGESVFLGLASIWGLSAGNLVELSFFEDADRNESREAIFELLGEITYVGGAYLATDTLKPTWQDSITITAGGLTSMTMAAGILAFIDATQDKRKGFAALLTAQLAGLGVSSYLTKDMKFSAGDLTLISYGLLEGMWYGGFLTSVVDGRSDHTDAGVLLGASLGTMAATWMSQNTELHVKEVLMLGAAGGYGKLLGTGLGLLTNLSSDGITSFMLAGGAIATGSAYYLREDVKFGLARILLTPISTNIGFAHGVAAGVILDSQRVLNSSQTGGLIITAGAAFGIGASLIAQDYDLKSWDVTMAGVGWLWGTWISGWTIALGDLDNQLSPAIVVAAGDIAMLTTMYLVSREGGNVDSRVVGWASVGGVGGASLAVLLTALVSTNSDAFISANLLGTAFGLGLGGYIAHTHFYHDGVETDAPTPGGPALSSSSSLPFELLGIGATPHLNDDGQFDGMMLNAAIGL